MATKKYIGKGTANPTNETAIELTRLKRAGYTAATRKATNLHKKYLEHPTAQFTMSFAEFKKQHKRD